jgi:hypothetical protein
MAGELMPPKEEAPEYISSKPKLTIGVPGSGCVN